MRFSDCKNLLGFFSILLLLNSCIKEDHNNFYWANQTTLLVNGNITKARTFALKSKNNDWINLYLMIEDNDVLTSLRLFSFFDRKAIFLNKTYSIIDKRESPGEPETMLTVLNDKTGEPIKAYFIDSTQGTSKIVFQDLGDRNMVFEFEFFGHMGPNSPGSDSIQIKSLAAIKCPIRRY